MSSKLLSKLLCKNNKANSTQTWGRSTTATAKKKGYLVVSGPHDNFDKLTKKTRRTGNFVWSGAVIFIYFFYLRGVDTGSVGLVETRVFFTPYKLVYLMIVIETCHFPHISTRVSIQITGSFKVCRTFFKHPMTNFVTRHCMY